MPDRVIRRLYYARKFGRLPHLKNPELFTELIQVRMLNDHSKQMAWTCDKLKMKEFARENTSNARIPETLWFGDNLADLCSRKLPLKWVLKPNHRSQAVYFGEGAPDLVQLAKSTRGWLRVYERAYFGEWAYREAKKCFLVEEHLGNGQVINDYKFYVFGGVPRLIQVDSDRFSGHQRRFYTTEWQPLDYTNVFPMASVQEAPGGLSKMLAAAADLGRTFDFIRVDLYEVHGTVYFGEITPYPEGGMKPFEPHSLDSELGGLWERAASSTPQ
ncbi:hypothetical protein BJY26_003455 [Spelaeicoccus albus]|uniref:Teichuronopeptide biosynthesis TupA-like protein n=2 Tax=Spelaeicoccus albus TaxID=1280376 RepID=A0A7Z0D596_9MICO|nr:hypothetical protein [Spelaeicoccus albus]